MKLLATGTNFLAYILLLFTEVKSKSSAPQACGERGVCICEDTPYITVDCSSCNLHQFPLLPLEVEGIDLSDNFIENININTFRGFSQLSNLNMMNNKLKEIPEDVFIDQHNMLFLTLSSNNIRTLYTNSFRGLDSLQLLDLSKNYITILPDNLYVPIPRLSELDLGENAISSVSNETFNGLSSMSPTLLSLRENKLSVLPQDLFSSVVLWLSLDLSDNHIASIPPGIFNTNHEPHDVEILYLHRNFLSYLNRTAFVGLDQLRIVFLFDNHIHAIDDGTFRAFTLERIYLFNNQLSGIEGNPFGKGQDISEVHLFGNTIKTISDKALQALSPNSVIYTNCYLFKKIPRDAEHAMIKCVNPTSVPAIPDEGYGPFSVSTVLQRAGFICEERYCHACPLGTFGDRHEDGCIDCPAGGFYQDEVGHASPYPDGPPCKFCNNGTFVMYEGSESVRDCQVCPEGTNKSTFAGYRACFCKDNYARTDRFGPCSSCSEEGLDCSKDFTQILPGYFWEWDFQTADLFAYEQFAINMTVETKEAAKFAGKYTKEIPRVHRCPRLESCLNNNGSIGGNCAKGYKGWLCASCESGYYAVLNECVQCPEKSTLILKIGCFLGVFVFICYLFSLQVKRDAKRDQQKRSIINIIISRVKILLGFYQVVGELYASLHEASWSGPLVIIGTFISSMELNVLRLFVRPRCFDPKLVINPKMQFIITISIPGSILLLSVLVYRIQKAFFKLRYLLFRVTFPQLKLQNFKSLLVTCDVVLLFLIYPPVCTVIFQLYPHTCETFYLDNSNKYSINRLRSDLDFDCSHLSAYHKAAYAFTALYVVAFPTVLLYLLWRNCRGITANGSIQENKHLQEEESFVINNSSRSKEHHAWFIFLCENYKSQYWFWEIIELSRKVTQTMLVTLFGWENRLTVLLTTGISVLFLVLHARYRPMESLYEQRLQMFSLTTIFINVLVASNEVSEGYKGSISTILIFLNVVVLIIVIAEIVLIVITSIKHASSSTSIISTLRDVRSMVNSRHK